SILRDRSAGRRDWRRRASGACLDDLPDQSDFGRRVDMRIDIGDLVPQLPGDVQDLAGRFLRHDETTAEAARSLNMTRGQIRHKLARIRAAMDSLAPSEDSSLSNNHPDERPRMCSPAAGSLSGPKGQAVTASERSPCHAT